jgi:hypothetical protein
LKFLSLYLPSQNVTCIKYVLELLLSAFLSLDTLQRSIFSCDYEGWQEQKRLSKIHCINYISSPPQHRANFESMMQRVFVYPLMLPPTNKSLCFLKNLTDGRHLAFKHSTYEPFAQNHDTTWESFLGIMVNHINLISHSFLLFMKLYENLFVPVMSLELGGILIWRFLRICWTQD